MKEFKDKQGRWRTTSLFFETASRESREEYECPFTKKEEDHTHEGVTYICLKALYVGLGDPTEYLFANEYLGGWSHWKRIVDSPTLRPWVDECREELKLKLMAEGIVVMRTKAAEGNVTAAKELMTKGWILEGKKTRGRPSQAEVEGVTKQMAADELEHQNDLGRMIDGSTSAAH